MAAISKLPEMRRQFRALQRQFNELLEKMGQPPLAVESEEKAA
jgi:hypothetical protein